MEFGSAGIGTLVGIAVAVIVCWLSGPEFNCVGAGAGFVVIGIVAGLLLDWKDWKKSQWSDKHD